jgi:hypothetical protein
MSQDPQRQSVSQSSLSTARYIHAALGDLARLAQQAELESTEVMILAARMEALGVMRRLRGEPLPRSNPAARD